MERLPVEILYYILDNLDTETILFSIRPTCRLFHAVANTYDRYKFDFKKISKSNFHLFFQLIPPQNVTSLTLVGNEYLPNQVSLFMSSIRLRQMTRLQSVVFSGIDEYQLHTILKRINLSLVTSFSLMIQTHDNRRRKTTSHFISSILEQKSLHRIELNIKDDRLICPSISHIKQLVINRNFDFNTICKLLLCSPQLRTLTFKQGLRYTSNELIMETSFPQITSLIIEEFTFYNYQIEPFLMLMPSLTYLKLVGRGSSIDGKSWEVFFTFNLLHLNKFEFFVYISNPNRYLETILHSFRSPFWIEYKKWFVTGETNSFESNSFLLYSVPICKSLFTYELHGDKTFVSTHPTLTYTSPVINQNITTLHLSLKMASNSNLHNNVSSPCNPLFPNVIKLQITFDSGVLFDSIDLLHSIIDVSQLVTVEFYKYYCDKDDHIVLCKMMDFFGQSSKLSSFIIRHDYYRYITYSILKNIYTKIPRQIKHLEILLNKLDQLEIILERCPDLSFAKFKILRQPFSAEVAQWFVDNTIGSTHSRHNSYDMVWIGKRKNDIKTSHKRIKLTDDNQL